MPRGPIRHDAQAEAGWRYMFKPSTWGGGVSGVRVYVHFVHLFIRVEKEGFRD